ncbi:MAG: class I SAM-dependent methyltransferase [bacterium]
MTLWDLKAPVYQTARKIFPFNLILAKEVENLRKLLAALDGTGATILDLGTGSGATLDLFPTSATVIALDSSIKMIHKISKRGKINCVVADAQALPFKSGSINVAAAVGLCEYLDHQLVFMRELQRVVDSKGCFLLTYSQKNPLNYLRRLLGHRLFLLSAAEFSALVQKCGLVCTQTKRSLIQRQVLLQNA